MENTAVTKDTEKRTAVKIPLSQDLENRIGEVHAAIAQRAYELFTNRGKVHGRDLEDWLEAESQIVHACDHDLRETAEAVVLRVEHCTFRADQLQVSVQPNRLIVSGETELDVLCGGHWIAHVEKRTERILRVHDLPTVVDPSRATATLGGETLEIVMPKVGVDSNTKKKEKSLAMVAGR